MCALRRGAEAAVTSALRVGLQQPRRCSSQVELITIKMMTVVVMMIEMRWRHDATAAATVTLRDVPQLIKYKRGKMASCKQWPTCDTQTKFAYSAVAAPLLWAVISSGVDLKMSRFVKLHDFIAAAAAAVVPAIHPALKWSKWHTSVRRSIRDRRCTQNQQFKINVDYSQSVLCVFNMYSG